MINSLTGDMIVQSRQWPGELIEYIKHKMLHVVESYGEKFKHVCNVCCVTVFTISLIIRARTKDEYALYLLLIIEIVS